MNNNYLTDEQYLLILLSRVSLTERDIRLVEKTLHGNTNFFELAKLAIYHKTFTLVFKNLIEDCKISIVPQYLYDLYITFKNSLIKIENNYQIEKQLIMSEFSNNGVDLIPVKGAMFIDDIYKINGTRYLSDLDFFIKKSDISIAESVMKSLGYSYGKVDKTNNCLRNATRKELLIWRLNMGNLFPFIRENKSEPEFFNVDIRFSISENLNDTFIEDIFKMKYSNKTIFYYMLLIHLCVHFYIETKQTVNIYSNTDFNIIKLCDIREFIANFINDFSLDYLLKLANKYCSKNEVLYAIYYVYIIYQDEKFSKIKEYWTKENEDDLSSYGDTIEEQTETFTKNLYQRLFSCNNRDELSRIPNIYTVSEKMNINYKGN